MGKILMEHFSSRKFILLCGLYFGSGLFAWFKPEFVGTAQTLFTFWIFLCSLYFGANVGEKIAHSLTNKNKT